jgi:hypothetical protein
MSNTNTNVPYTIKTNGSITLYLNGECMTVATDHPNYNKVIDALKTGETDGLETLINVAKAVVQYASGQIRVENGVVFYGSFELHNTLTNRILRMMNEGFKFDHMIKFLENLLQNPSNRAVNETYTFLENYGLPITDDGCFLAYKAVRNDYKDIYSGTIDNSIGATPSMPRNMVDEVYERDCSTGLHVGALDYVVQYGHFVKGAVVSEGGNRLLLVKVNPKDVVSVPLYAGHPKMRVSQYTVVSEIKDVVKELDKVVYTAKAETLAPDFEKPADSYPEDDDEPDADDPDGEDEDTDQSEYDEGYTAGVTDKNDGTVWGYGLPSEASDEFKAGYADGYLDA